jgi:hypothetical protein
MRYIVILVCGTLMIGCSYEKVFNSDIDKFLAAQLQNNRLEIDQVKNDLKDLKIDTLRRNVALVGRLELLHKQLLTFSDSLDSLDKRYIKEAAMKFIDNTFDDLDSFNEAAFEVDENTPRQLVKLHLAMLESHFISQHRFRYDYNDSSVPFDHFAIAIVPSKTTYKQGENITGELIFCIQADFKALSKVMKAVKINGQIVAPGDNGWQFEIPSGLNAGEHQLSSEAIMSDGKTFQGTRKIHVQP